MADCDRIKEHFSDYIEKRLSPQTRKEVKFHLQECRDCRLIVDQLPQVKSLLINLDAIRCNENFNLKLRQRLSEDRGESFLSGENVKRLSYGFSFVVAIFLVFFGFNIFTEGDNTIGNSNPQVVNKEITPAPVPSNQLVNHTKNNFESADELEVKTKNSENSYSDSTTERKHEEKNPHVKYVDTK